LQDGYNLLLRKGWTCLTPQLLVLLQCTIRLHHPRIVRLLPEFLGAASTDLVLSVIPHFNACLAESIQKEISGAPFVTVLTDLADYPPNFWIERNSEYLICRYRKGAATSLFDGAFAGPGLSRLLAWS